MAILSRTVLSPRGKRMSLRQYLALLSMKRASPLGAFDCTDGHFECAAWRNGPCSAEAEAFLEQERGLQ